MGWIIAAVIVAAVIIVLLFLKMARSSLYAELWRIKSDVTEYGLAGIKRHLSDGMYNSLVSLRRILDKKGVTVSGDMLIPTVKLNTVIRSSVWWIKTIKQSDRRADVVAGFNYQDIIVGTVGFSIAKYSDGWKIDSISFPQFTKLEL